MSEHKSLWSLIRAVLTQGAAIEMDSAAGKFATSEEYFQRFDEAAREREPEFTPLLCRDELLAMVKRYARECAECEGTGQVRSFNPRRPAKQEHGADCEDCREIRDLIEKATGQ